MTGYTDRLPKTILSIINEHCASPSKSCIVKAWVEVHLLSVCRVELERRRKCYECFLVSAMGAANICFSFQQSKHVILVNVAVEHFAIAISFEMLSFSST